jgi:hypothetical protein
MSAKLRRMRRRAEGGGAKKAEDEDDHGLKEVNVLEKPHCVQ